MIPDLAIRYDFGTVWDFLFDPIILEALWVTLQISILAMVLGFFEFFSQEFFCRRQRQRNHIIFKLYFGLGQFALKL